MGDRTAYTLLLTSAVPDDALTAALEAFTQDTWSAADVARLREHAPTGQLSVFVEQRSVGETADAAEAIREALAEHGHDVPFAVSEDPAYEWLGNLCRYHPEHGMHEVDCDANGTPVLSGSTLTALLDTVTPDQLPAKLHELLGTDWSTPAQQQGLANPVPA